MSLTKTTTKDKIEIVHAQDEEGNAVTNVHVREKIEISEGGTIISTNFHRYTITQGNDYSGESTQVRAVCDAAWPS